MTDDGYTYYEFDLCVGGYFEMATSDARGLLPDHLQPTEVQHERSVLAVTAFRFTGSEVGEYDEIVLALVVPPIVEPGKPLPKAAIFPFMVGTSTKASRMHAIERWHLPHYMEDLDFDFAYEGDQVTVHVSDAGTPVLDLTVTDFAREKVKSMYSCFTVEGDERYKVSIHMEADHTEHEEERGALNLYPHPMTEGLTIEDVSSYPFREEWYGRGVQTFERMESF